MKIQILRHFSVLLVSCVFICVDHITLAQHSAVGNSSQVLTDTINISGIILDSNGRPAKNVFISRPWYQCYPSFKTTTITDSMGKFRLNGIRFKDTLQIQAPNFSRQIINNGSRMFRIILPAVNDVTTSIPVKLKLLKFLGKNLLLLLVGLTAAKIT